MFKFAASAPVPAPHTWETSASFSTALGQLGATISAFDAAMRHAVMHAISNGQVTPANRLHSAVVSAGLTGGAAWRVTSDAIAAALAPYAVFSPGEGWRMKKNAETIGRAQAAVTAAALPSVSSMLEAAKAAKASKAAERKAASKTTQPEEKAPDTSGVSVAVTAALSMLAKGAEQELTNAEPARKAGKIVEYPLSAVLATMPGALKALGLMIHRAEMLAVAGEAKASADALRSFVSSHATETEQAREERDAAEMSRQAAERALIGAQREAAELTEQARAIAEQAAEMRRTAAALMVAAEQSKHEAAHAIEAAAILASEAAATSAQVTVKSKRTRKPAVVVA